MSLMTDKAKKDQKNLEKLLKEIFSLDKKEKQKSECVMKLNEMMESYIDLNMNFELLISSVDDLYLSPVVQVKKTWLILCMNIIRLRQDFRERLFEKIIKVAFSLNMNDKEDILLKIKVSFIYK
jgi:hypothetical protein